MKRHLIAGGLDVTEWLQLAMAALGAVGVFAVPNTPTTLDGQPAAG